MGDPEKWYPKIENGFRIVLAAANENQDEINLEIDERSATTIMVSF
jgi:hypothetical protein